jgi:RNA polymerase sigma factor (sigma-70 family)
MTFVRPLMRPQTVAISADATDSELAEAVRRGDPSAFAHLWSRHLPFARATAHALTSADKVDDLVSEGFARILRLLRNGKGPTDNFRAYLVRTLRSIHIDVARAYASRVSAAGLNDDLEPSLPPVTDRDSFDGSTALRAWASLDAADRMILWSSVVDGSSVTEVAAAVDIKPSLVAIRTFRAREHLREAFLREHVQSATDTTCRKHRYRLGSYARGTLADSKRRQLEKHLAHCIECTEASIEIVEVNRSLKLALGPMLLGGGAVGAIAGARHAAKSGLESTAQTMAYKAHRIGLSIRPAVAQHRITTLAAGTALSGVAIFGLVIGTSQSKTTSPPIESPTASPAAIQPSVTPTPGPSASPTAARRGPRPTVHAVVPPPTQAHATTQSADPTAPASAASPSSPAVNSVLPPVSSPPHAGQICLNPQDANGKCISH